MYTGANNKKKPKNQISFIDFSYWYYKFNLLPIIGTWYCIVPPHYVERLTPHYIKHTPSY